MLREFVKEVNDFMSIYCGEYMSEKSVEYDFEDKEVPSALIKLGDHYNRFWEVPVFWTGNEALIDIGDAGALKLNGHGLYVYLWHEACSRINTQKLSLKDV